MGALARDLRRICRHNKDGSYKTQKDRENILMLCARDLETLGIKAASAHSIKPKYTEKLVEFWQTNGVSDATIANRVCALRYWAAAVDKANVVPRTNAELGIERRSQSNENKAQRLDLEKGETLPCKRMQLACKAMSAFGLRMEEALKLNASFSDKGDHIALKASWCKGGRARVIPLTMPERQRALLDEIKAVCGSGSLIPDDKSYIQHRKAFENQTLKAGFSNLHGLRHNYAQVRYKALTGWECPKRGGMDYKAMTAEQREIDKDVRLKISEELGHSRMSITKIYLG
ncbi:MAG: integrase [Marinovum sp.]|nr:integrase [Marinovum sp.]